jgi:hypothetical protein
VKKSCMDRRQAGGGGETGEGKEDWTQSLESRLADGERRCGGERDFMHVVTHAGTPGISCLLILRKYRRVRK